MNMSSDPLHFQEIVRHLENLNGNLDSVLTPLQRNAKDKNIEEEDILEDGIAQIHKPTQTHTAQTIIVKIVDGESNIKVKAYRNPFTATWAFVKRQFSSIGKKHVHYYVGDKAREMVIVNLRNQFKEIENLLSQNPSKLTPNQIDSIKTNWEKMRTTLNSNEAKMRELVDFIASEIHPPREEWDKWKNLQTIRDDIGIGVAEFRGINKNYNRIQKEIIKLFPIPDPNLSIDDFFTQFETQLNTYNTQKEALLNPIKESLSEEAILNLEKPLTDLKGIGLNKIKLAYSEFNGSLGNIQDARGFQEKIDEYEKIKKHYDFLKINESLKDINTEAINELESEIIQYNRSTILPNLQATIGKLAKTTEEAIEAKETEIKAKGEEIEKLNNDFENKKEQLSQELPAVKAHLAETSKKLRAQDENKTSLADTVKNFLNLDQDKNSKFTPALELLTILLNSFESLEMLNEEEHSMNRKKINELSQQLGFTQFNFDSDISNQDIYIALHSKLATFASSIQKEEENKSQQLKTEPETQLTPEQREEMNTQLSKRMQTRAGLLQKYGIDTDPKQNIQELHKKLQEVQVSQEDEAPMGVIRLLAKSLAQNSPNAPEIEKKEIPYQTWEELQPTFENGLRIAEGFIEKLAIDQQIKDTTNQRARLEEQKKILNNQHDQLDRLNLSITFLKVPGN